METIAIVIYQGLSAESFVTDESLDPLAHGAGIDGLQGMQGQHDFQLGNIRRSESRNAMRSSENPLAIDQTASAKVSSGRHHRYLK